MPFPTIYVDTGGAATNSGSSDQNGPNLSGAAATVSSTTVTLDGSPDLSTLATDGSMTIRLADATNANQKIFKIVGKDDGADTVTVDIAPTGITSTAWAIGGRFLATGGNLDTDVTGALDAGWTLRFNNSPASHSGSDFLPLRNSGNSTDGWITIEGKSGVRPVLTVSDTNQVIQPVANTVNYYAVRNLDCVQQGASGNAIDLTTGGQPYLIDDVVVSDAGGDGIALHVDGMVSNCEISGTGDSGIEGGDGLFLIQASYIHDTGGRGISLSNSLGRAMISRCTIDTCAGFGIAKSNPFAGSTHRNQFLDIWGCTIYGCGDSGIHIADADLIGYIYNNILQDNGNAAGEFNVEVANPGQDLLHGYNVFYHQGGGGGANLSGVTANATESTADPLFTDPANGDFSLQAGSPAIDAGLAAP